MRPNTTLATYIGSCLSCCWRACLPVAWSLGTSLAALAHPLGNFTINRYSKLTADAQALRLAVCRRHGGDSHPCRARPIDADGDGLLSGPELDSYRSAIATQLLQGLALTVDGAAVPLTPTLH